MLHSALIIAFSLSAPLNYSYLSERSILRLLFDFLGQAGKIGNFNFTSWMNFVIILDTVW